MTEQPLTKKTVDVLGNRMAYHERGEGSDGAGLAFHPGRFRPGHRPGGGEMDDGELALTGKAREMPFRFAGFVQGWHPAFRHSG